MLPMVSISWRMRVGAWLSVKSICATALMPGHSLCNCRSTSMRRPASASCQPFMASRCATSLPMPDVAPMTRAFFTGCVVSIMVCSNGIMEFQNRIIEFSRTIMRFLQGIMRVRCRAGRRAGKGVRPVGRRRAPRRFVRDGSAGCAVRRLRAYRGSRQRLG